MALTDSSLALTQYIRMQEAENGIINTPAGYTLILPQWELEPLLVAVETDLAAGKEKKHSVPEAHLQGKKA